MGEVVYTYLVAKFVNPPDILQLVYKEKRPIEIEVKRRICLGPVCTESPASNTTAEARFIHDGRLVKMQTCQTNDAGRCTVDLEVPAELVCKRFELEASADSPLPDYVIRDKIVAEGMTRTKITLIAPSRVRVNERFQISGTVTYLNPYTDRYEPRANTRVYIMVSGGENEEGLEYVTETDQNGVFSYHLTAWSLPVDMYVTASVNPVFPR